VFQQPDLMAADLAQPVWRQLLLDVEVEHGGRAIVRRRIVGRAGEARGACSVLYTARIALFERCELAEPAGQHRPQHASARDTEKTIALAELAVLVAAAGDERFLESELADVERHDVEM